MGRIVIWHDVSSHSSVVVYRWPKQWNNVLYANNFIKYRLYLTDFQFFSVPKSGEHLYSNTISKTPTTPQEYVKYQCLKATIENKTISVTTL